LPEGAVTAVYQAVLPYEALTAGESYEFTYIIRAVFSSPMVDEDFNIQVSLDPAFGTASVDQSTITLLPGTSEATVVVTVVPSGVLNTADLLVTARSAREPALVSTQQAVTLAIGVEPPLATFYFYSGLAFNTQGRLEIPQNHLTRAQGSDILFTVQNTSTSETRTFDVTEQAVPSVGNTAGWAPLAATAVAGSPFLVAASGEASVFVNVLATDAANVPPVGTIGNIVSVATVIVDGTPQTVTVTVPFIVDDPA
jgi:hypothetical protein